MVGTAVMVTDTTAVVMAASRHGRHDEFGALNTVVTVMAPTLPIPTATIKGSLAVWPGRYSNLVIENSDNLEI